ncbi:MAG: T9SS type A sorting domain-containing protein [Ignavibacteriaceae bacterium]|nr:MAG: T9SS C-terminal target domain-containing protein [Chlorobiota bacterium]MBV6398524.1 hypothetical protein [Ignavibacteria bacterium]MCC6885759.1 T9SS type A sorting domain-containing protein [Ignavibacteriales bacterium]MCE7953046.1 T9SS C-terminal target domain-containing protein [Chlorobi bacterium CHB7]MDL1887116.1 T9SS type A sorting domain-containing protein [Ignavibacteria bacterium CHB1]MEB2329171.1 T9SS type A sorting domain-containing protein [Ignavibacteriaceae bacterium]RIK
MKFLAALLIYLFISNFASAQSQNWSKLYGPFKGQVNDFEVVSGNSNIVLATGSEGIFRTTNSGLNWQNVSGVGSNVISISTNDPNIILTNNSKSFDGGLSWAGAQIVDLIELKFAPGSNTIAYGIKIDGIVIRTTDLGTSWHVIDDSLSVYGTFKSLMTSLTEPSVVYTLSDSGYLSKSTDFGNTWQRIRFTERLLTGVCGVVSFKNNQRIIIAADDSVYVSNSGTSGFAAYYNQATSFPKKIIIDEQFTNTLYILSWYMNSPKSVHRSTNGGITWESIFGNAVTGSNIRSTIDGKLYFSGYYSGIYLSTDQGQNFTSIGYKNIEPEGIKNTGNETFYAWDQSGYFRTNNGGANWTLIHGTGGFYPNSLSISNQNHNKIYVSNFSSLSISTDAGRNWIDKNVSALGTLNEIYVMNQNDEIIFAKGFNQVSSSFILGRSTNNGDTWGLINKPSSSYFWNLKLNDGAPADIYFIPSNSVNTNLFRSTDLGSTWTDIAPILEPAQYLHDVSSDPTGKLYCGAASFYTSNDFGNNWDIIYQYIYPRLQIYLLYIDFQNTNKIYSIDPNTKRLYGSSNGGIHWYWADSGLPEVYNINIASITPNSKVLLSTEKGVFYGTPILTVDIKPISEIIPEEFSLEQNFPNPFNPETKLRFNIPMNSAIVNLSIYDATGRIVATLINSPMKAGEYEILWDATGLPGGIYYSVLRNDTQVRTIKMVLLK